MIPVHRILHSTGEITCMRPYSEHLRTASTDWVLGDFHQLFMHAGLRDDSKQLTEREDFTLPDPQAAAAAATGPLSRRPP